MLRWVLVEKIFQRVLTGWQAFDSLHLSRAKQPTKEKKMISALVLSSFLFVADTAPELDILVEEPTNVCTSSGCPIGGHIEVEKPSEEGSK